MSLLFYEIGSVPDLKHISYALTFNSENILTFFIVRESFIQIYDYNMQLERFTNSKIVYLGKFKHNSVVIISRVINKTSNYIVFYEDLNENIYFYDVYKGIKIRLNQYFERMNLSNGIIRRELVAVSKQNVSLYDGNNNSEISFSDYYLILKEVNDRGFVFYYGYRLIKDNELERIYHLVPDLVLSNAKIFIDILNKPRLIAGVNESSIDIKIDTTTLTIFAKEKLNN
ncbi:MAG: hypothetical protein QXX12_03390 [Nanopusillaceae archaeon]